MESEKLDKSEEDLKVAEAPNGNYKSNGQISTIQKPDPLDGGWGWMVVFGAILVMITAQMISSSFGIMFSTMLRSLKVSSTTVSWIFNIQCVTWNISQLLAGPLSEVFSWRPVAMFGALVTTLSIILSAFATSAAYLFFSFSILGGLGAGLSVAVCFFIIPCYFKKYRGQAMAMMLLGSCFGQFLCPIAISYLQSTYGFFGANLLLGGLALHSVVGCALFRPLRHSKPKRSLYERPQNIPLSTPPNKDILLLEEENLFKISLQEKTQSSDDCYCKNICKPPSRLVTEVGKLLWRNVVMIKSFRAVIIAVGISICFIGYLNFNMMVAFSIQNDGYTLEDAAWCTSVSGIGNMVARSMILLISNWPKFNRKLGYMFGTLCLSIGILSFTFAPSLSLSLACMSVVGFGTGALITLYPLVIIDIMSMTSYAQTFGFASIFIAFYCVTVGPMTGFIRDYFGSYTASMRMISGLVAISFILWLFMPVAVRYDNKKNKSHDTEDVP